AAAREERDAGASARPSGPAGDDPRALSRERLHTADAAINEFRARVRSDLRSHVARGGLLAASVVDDLSRALDEAARNVTRALRD
ncbi:MAG: PadR family transcriptional regulator, partial [Microbacterium sp.]